MARKAFLYNVTMERKQVFERVEDGLVHPALSKLYLNYCADQPEGSVTDVYYLQEHEETQKRKGQEETSVLGQQAAHTLTMSLTMMESMGNLSFIP